MKKKFSSVFQCFLCEIYNCLKKVFCNFVCSCNILIRVAKPAAFKIYKMKTLNIKYIFNPLFTVIDIIMFLTSALLT